MFKFFTWTKFAGWLGIAGAILTGPGAVILGLPSTTVGAIAAIITGVSSLVTTHKAGSATDGNNVPLNQGGGG